MSLYGLLNLDSFIFESQFFLILKSMKKLKDLFQLELAHYDRVYNFRGSLIHQYDEIKDKAA